MFRGKWTKAAFTLIELLVVVAIIAVLISILLPSLSEAREQGKLAKCLANLKMTMTTTQVYFSEWNDVFPFVVTTRPGWLGVCTWSYAGKKTDDYWEPDKGLFFFWANQKAMNRYFLNAPVEKDAVVESLHCPSDNMSHQRGQEMPISSWDDVGTSYHYNLFAFGDGEVWPFNNGKIWNNNGAGWIELGRGLVRETQQGFSGRFIMIYEEPVDYSFWDSTQQMGYHKKFSKHAAGYIDGHAEYKLMDTRKWCGLGWVGINPNWVKGPGWRSKYYYIKKKFTCD